MGNKYVRIDGAIWDSTQQYPIPLCPTHRLPMELSFNGSRLSTYVCPEDGEQYDFRRERLAQIRYVHGKVKSNELKAMKVLNLDDEAIPLAQDKDSSADGRFFVVAKLTESKVGLRLVVYAGQKGSPNKTQLFIEPDVRRASFDQKDLNPLDVFTKVEATFRDGSKGIIES